MSRCGGFIGVVGCLMVASDLRLTVGDDGPESYISEKHGL